MPYYIHAEDKEGAVELRLKNREAHLAYIKKYYNDKMIAAGPMLADDGETMIGSVILIDLEGRAAVDEYCAGDPYAQAGLYASINIKPFKHVFPMKD